jgi:excisionase family DNA binding protein
MEPAMTTTPTDNLANVPHPAGEKLLTFAEVAQRLGVDVNTIRRNVRAEQIPVVVVGRKRRIPAAWVDDPQGWLQPPA